MIRVTSGTAKGKRLDLPKNAKVTAVKEVVKLAIFSIIGEKINGRVCLDLFAGSGNLGIEALSRGAAYCDFIDESKTSVEIVEKNLRNTKLSGQAGVIWDDVIKFLANTQSTYDIVFADPYYTQTNNKHLIKTALSRLNQDGTLFLLTSSAQTPAVEPDDIPENVRYETRKYGKTLLTVLTSRP